MAKTTLGYKIIVYEKTIGNQNNCMFFFKMSHALQFHDMTRKQPQ